jgi:hypothetical protein
VCGLNIAATSLQKEIKNCRHPISGYKYAAPVALIKSMKPPGEFFEDLERLQSHFDWMAAAFNGNDDDDVSKGKLMAAEFREFEQKWGTKIRDAEFRDALAAVRKIMAGLESKLEELRRRHLQKLIQARKEWMNAESFLQATVAITVLRREMPERLRAEFEETLRDPETGESFNAEKHFRECEQRIAETEADYRKAWAGFEVDWPEWADAAMRSRLEKLDAEDARRWETEITKTGA